MDGRPSRFQWWSMSANSHRDDVLNVVRARWRLCKPRQGNARRDTKPKREIFCYNIQPIQIWSWVLFPIPFNTVPIPISAAAIITNASPLLPATDNHGVDRYLNTKVPYL